MRVGRTLSQNGPSAPCTLYRVVPGDDRKGDEWIGVAFTTEIAEAICAAVNALGQPLPATSDEGRRSCGVPGTGEPEGNVAGSAGLVGSPAKTHRGEGASHG